nr:hypothetical protein [Tanacetum cinerariifolium]
MKENDAILKNMQTNMTSLTNSNLELKNMFGQFMKMNTTSSSGSRTLPGPTIPTTSSSPVVERETEATKDMVHPTNNESTEYVQPPVVQTESLILTSEPVIAPIIEPVASPVSDLRPSQRPSTLYPSRFARSEALLLTNKDKLCELARTPLNEHCSAVLLKKFPEKLGDPGKFLIPCDFPRMVECLALADLGASINLMPFSVWNKLSLPDLSPMCMTIELADRLISRLVGVAEDVFVKVGTFHFPADFVVVDFDADPRVPLILDRSFLKIGRALIDVFKEYSQEDLGFSDVISSGNPTPYYDPIVSTTSLTLTPFGNSDFLLEEVDAFLALKDEPTLLEVDQCYLDTDGDILLLEYFMNDDPSLPPPNQGNYLPEVHKELKICKAKTDKSSIDEPPKVKLKDLPPHLEYAFLEGDDMLPVIIAKDLSVEEKTALITVLKSHKRAIDWKLFDIKGIDPEFCTQKIVMEEDFKPARVCIDYRKLNKATRKDHFPLSFMDQMLERLAGNHYYCFLDGFSVFRNYFQACLSHLEKILKRCKDTKLYLNWEKSYFMVKEGIVLSHKISKEGIEVDKAKVDVIAKLPYPTTVKDIRSFLAPILITPDWDMPFELMCDASDLAIGAVLGQRQDKHFRPIHYASKTMTEAESSYTTTEKEVLAVVYAFKKFRSYLIMNKCIMYMNHSALKYLFAKKDSKAILLRWVLLLQEFTFKVIDIKGAENLALIIFPD